MLSSLSLVTEMESGRASFEPLSLPLEASAFYCLSPPSVAGFKGVWGRGWCGIRCTFSSGSAEGSAVTETHSSAKLFPTER